MTTPHKWAEVIKAWADGKEVQYAYIVAQSEWITAIQPNFHSETIVWRIKPKTVKYRRYITNGINGPVVMVVHSPYEEGKAESVWCKTFIRWIDAEWQEEEV